MSTLTRSTPTRSGPPRAAAPPARLPRTPVPAGLRFLEVVRGLLAAVVLIAVAVGIPLALVHLVGDPLPGTAPTRAWLDAELTAGAVVDVLAVVLWLLWAHFLVCVVAEFLTWSRGGTAGRLPFGGAGQVLAQRLVAAVLLLAAGGGLAPSVPVAAAPVAAVVAVDTRAVEATPTATTGALPEAGWAAAAPAGAAGTVTYVVAPPQGRHHDCLWDIAERTLGDPLRYREVFELNRDRVQADGSRLVDADLIRPGWVLLLPADAVGTTAAPLAAPPAPTPAPPPTPADATSDLPAPGWAPTSPADGVEVEPTSRHGDPVALETTGTPPVGTRTPTAVGGGLLAAGALVGLTRRGRGGTATADRLRRTADPAGARFLLDALQALAAACARDGRPLPAVVAAHLSADDLVLHPAERSTGEASDPPAPWTALPGGAWRLARTALPAGDAGRAPGRAVDPYPLLVDVVADGAHALLLDLESAPGPVSVGGPADSARDVVTALAAGLATGAWSGGADVHLVGFGDELSALAPGTLHSHDRLTEVLPGLEALRARCPADLLSARVPGATVPPRPCVVVLSGPPAPDELRRLQAVTTGGRTPVAVLCVGDLPEAGWRFHVDAAGVLDLGVLGLRGTARRLPPAEYAPWLAALRAAV